MFFNVSALSACSAGTQMALLCSQVLNKKYGTSMAGDFVFTAAVTNFLVGGCESSCWKILAVTTNVDTKPFRIYRNKWSPL